MKKALILIVFLTVTVSVLSIASCSRAPVVRTGDKPPPLPEDPWRKFVEACRYNEDTRGEDWTRIRAGLDTIGRHFNKPDVVNSVDVQMNAIRKFLESDVHLTADEIAEVESPSMRTADAHYLDECFLLRDVVRSLEIGDLPTAQRAQQIFAWTMRNVLPHEQVETWVPPAFTLRRGYGGAMDRALLFLALLRQAEIEGCLIVVPDAEPKHFLVAALDSRGKSIYLFDTRLGLPLTNKSGDVLSLREALEQPALLKPAHLPEKDVEKLEAWLACPLFALSPRMQELQKNLNNKDSIVLYLNAKELATDVAAATKLKVSVWNPGAPTAATANSPTRSLRMFLPKQDGGVDDGMRVAKYSANREPLANVVTNWAEIAFTPDYPSKNIFNFMLVVARKFCGTYDLEVREMYLRGLYDSMYRPQERLHLFVKDDALANLRANRDFRTKIEAWFKEISIAGANLESDNPQQKAKAAMALNRLMAEDQFVLWLVELGVSPEAGLRVESLMNPETIRSLHQADFKREERGDRKYKKAELTQLLAVGLRERYNSELARSQASVNHEKAVYSQGALRKHTKADAKKAAEDAWRTAHSSWGTFYVDRIALDGFIKNGLAQVQRAGAERTEAAQMKQIHLLETLHLDVHKYFQAKLRIAECKEYLDGPQAAKAYRETIKREIEKLEKSDLLPPQVQNASGLGKAQPRVNLLARDWSSDGNFVWLKRQLDAR